MTRRAFSRCGQLAVAVILVAVTAGAADTSARYQKLNHEMICSCSCNELLGECNHVGCPSSPVMLNELSVSLASGKSDNQIFHEFQDEYGPVVLASPMFTRWNHVAWIVPPLALLLGIGGVLLVVRNWRMRTVPVPPTPSNPGFAAARERIRRETEI